MENMNKQIDSTLIVDIDGTLCELKSSGQTYAEVAPRQELIVRLREYRSKGYRILLFTSRNMRTYNSNIGLINKFTAPVLFDWLEKWDVPFDEVIFGKPWPGVHGFYIDDRSIRPDEFINLDENSIHRLLRGNVKEQL